LNERLQRGEEVPDDLDGVEYRVVQPIPMDELQQRGLITFSIRPLDHRQTDEKDQRHAHCNHVLRVGECDLRGAISAAAAQQTPHEHGHQLCSMSGLRR